MLCLASALAIGLAWTSGSQSGPLSAPISRLVLDESAIAAPSLWTNDLRRDQDLPVVREGANSGAVACETTPHEELVPAGWAPLDSQSSYREHVSHRGPLEARRTPRSDQIQIQI